MDILDTRLRSSGGPLYNIPDSQRFDLEQSAGSLGPSDRRNRELTDGHLDSCLYFVNLQER